MINSFSSYFELFAGLNPGYATFEGFRNAANTEIFRLNKKHLDLEEQISLLETKVTVLALNNTAFVKFRTDFEKKANELDQTVDDSIRLSRRFQIVFFLTSAFCFLLLLLGGFESYFTPNLNINLALNIINTAYFVIAIMIWLAPKDELTPKKSLVFLLCYVIYLVMVEKGLMPNSLAVHIGKLSEISLLSSLINILTTLLIPTLPFIVFYIRRYYNTKKAQKQIDEFHHIYTQQLSGFMTGIGIDIE